jgi:hypothetical protein
MRKSDLIDLLTNAQHAIAESEELVLLPVIGPDYCFFVPPGVSVLEIGGTGICFMPFLRPGIWDRHLPKR